jgi:hypothetical protein
MEANVMDIKNLILTGLVSSFVFVLSAFTLFFHYPRYMLRMLPKEFAPQNSVAKIIYNLFTIMKEDLLDDFVHTQD